MLHTSYIELSKSAFSKNLRYLRNLIGPGTIFSSVIKGNAYGHGISHFLPLAEECGVRHFSVFSADEALYAARSKMYEETELMIMGMIDNDEISWAVEQGISFYVFDLDRLKQAIRASRAQKKNARIHLELETGMHRTGFESDDLKKAVKLIRDNADCLTIEGICTHYAGAESISNYVRIKRQQRNFDKLVRWLRLQGIEGRYRHTACSAAALTYRNTIMDKVRIGIAQYGFWPSRETYMTVQKNRGIFEEDPLDRVLSWKSKVMSIKTIGPGEYVNYDNLYLTSRTQQAAAIPVGYTHGFGRNLTNQGMVLIRGQRAPVMGVVNMNMFLVDVTDIEGVEKDDEVVIIGKQGENEISVSSFSDMSNYLTYETLTRIPAETPRFVVP